MYRFNVLYIIQGEERREKMKEVMISLMESRLLLLASAFMLSWSSLQTLLKLSDEKKGGNVPIFIFSLINSLCLVAWDKFFPLPRPVAMMIIPTIIILELCLISRDDWWAYLNFFFLFLLDGFSQEYLVQGYYLYGQFHI